MYKKKITSALVILSCISLMFVVIPQAEGTQFIIASWTAPDEFGQGIHSWYANSNATGSWVSFAWGFHDEVGNSHSGPIPWNVSQVIQLTIWVTMNRTLLGLNSTALGKNRIQHNVTVTNQWDVEVFTKQNFTWVSDNVVSDIYWYRYSVILDFLPLEGEFYTVTVLSEIYW